MSFSPRIPRLLGMVFPLLALAFAIGLTVVRLHRVDEVTRLAQTEVTVDATSATGYAGGLRNLIVPEHNNDSFQWIIQTQQMLAPHGAWRIREVRYDNAPTGRTILTPSPYRWWLGFVAKIDHSISGRPIGEAVEQAARVSDPILFFLFLVAAVTLVAWRLGIWPAAALVLAAVTLFPFGGAFVPAQPMDGSLFLVCAAGSLLLMMAGIRSKVATSHPDDTPRPAGTPLQRGPNAPADPAWVPSREGCPQGGVCWFASGVALGVALWIDAVRATPVLIGVGLGGLLSLWYTRKARLVGANFLSLPWRAWALAGAATTLLAYLLEYYPDHLGTLNLREVHPLYGVTWLGLGELLHQWGMGAGAGSAPAIVAAAPSRSSETTASMPIPQMSGVKPDLRGGRWLRVFVVLLAVLSVATVPVALFMPDNRTLFSEDPATACLSQLSGSPIAENLWAWLVHDGINLAVGATCAPLLVMAIAVALLSTRATDRVSKLQLTLALGPAVVVAGFAVFHLRTWNDFDAVVLALVTAITAASVPIIVENAPRPFRARLPGWIYLVALMSTLLPGALLLGRKAVADRRDPISGVELQSLIERDLAHWLAKQSSAPGAVVLAPPNLTTALIYYGGLSGLGTPFWENKAGFVAASRIAGASTPDEAQAVANGRKLSYIVNPSWDNFLEEYARQGASDVQHSFIALLDRWLPPRWLRPVPYHLPKVPGFEDQSVAVFQSIDVQDNATALSYLAEYFAEMGMLDAATRVANALENAYPADLSAAAARAIVARATQNAEAFTHAFSDVQDALARGDDEILAWDRRVSLAIALVDGRRLDQAKDQIKHCLEEIDEPHLRSLTTVSLHRLLVMCRSFGLQIDKPALRSLAEQLLPPELRSNRSEELHHETH